MKAKILILVFLCAYSVSSFAQWGAKAGLDLSSAFSPSDISNLGPYEVGFHIGAIYDVPLSKKMFFQPGLLFCTNGFKFDTKDLIYTTKSEVKMYALEVPLVMSFRPSLGKRNKLLTEFGFYTRYNLFGKRNYVYKDNTVNNSSPFDAYTRFDFGLHLGLGLSYSNYFITGAYQLGMNALEKETLSKHTKIRISLGYMF